MSALQKAGIVLVLAAAVVVGASSGSWVSPDACVFDPKPDITTYELALIVKHLNSTNSGGVIAMFRDHPELRRHMRDPECMP